MMPAESPEGAAAYGAFCGARFVGPMSTTVCDLAPGHADDSHEGKHPTGGRFRWPVRLRRDPSSARVTCDGYDWRDGTPRECALRLGHRGSCSGEPCKHPVYMDGRCYDCGEPHPADCDCGMRPPVPVESLPVDLSRQRRTDG